MKNAFYRSGFYLALCFVFLGSACQKYSERKVNLAFYHWKSTLALSGFEKNYLNKVAAARIYLRFFDVDWDGSAGQALPIAELSVENMLADSLEIVPTVFITNRTFLNLKPEDISEFAEKVLKKISQISAKFPDHEIKELQFDCDWSAKTRQSYFAFLKEIKLKSQSKPLRLSSTIRLHQIKFFEKTGVPPVDRGALMFYNMGNLEDIEAENSILDLNVAKQYLYNFDDYPLPLDLALPIFSWGVLIREGSMIKLINNLKSADLNDESRFLKIDETRFELIKSTYLQGHYLYKGDVIRLEKVSLELLHQSVDLLDGVFADSDRTLIFYHLDSIAINDYPHEKLEEICDRFR